MKNKILENNLEKLLKYDSLAEAEKVTGKSYKDDKITAHLGFIGILQNNIKKENALLLLDDKILYE
jgi:hypothetical protein